jgi:hypothetical protein
MNKSNAPINQAERPLFVMKQQVTAAIMTTKPMDLQFWPGEQCNLGSAS